MSPRAYRSLLLLAASALTAPGCSTPPALPESTRPLWDFVVRSETYAGSPLSGPVDAADLPVDPAAWFDVDIELIHLDRFPGDALDSLAARSGLIARPAAGDPIRSLHVDPTTSRLGSGGAAEQFVDELTAGRHGRPRPMASGHSALAPGTTLCLLGGGVEQPPPLPAHSAQPLPPHVGEIELHRSRLDGDGAEGPLRLALIHPASLSNPNGEDRASSQLLVNLDPWDGGEQTIVVVTPTARMPGSLVVIYRLRPADSSPGHAAAVVAARDQAQRALWGAALIAAPRTPAEVLLATTVSGLGGWRTRQQSLLLLAEQTGADFAFDLLLWNRRDLAELLAEALLAEQPVGVDPRTLGWQLERNAYRIAAELAAETIPVIEAESLLARHAGEAGRHPVVLEELIERSDDLPSFGARLLRANFVFLEDSTSAARVRAYDWLVQRDAAPEGYDPLGTRRERSQVMAGAEFPGLP